MKQNPTARNVLQIMNENSEVPRTKSVGGLSAQSIGLCEAGNNLDKEIERILSLKVPIMLENRILWYIIEIQLRSGCRVSEVLAIGCEDVFINNSILIKGAKGSSNRVVSVYDCFDYLWKCKVSGIVPFQEWDRFRVYRDYKKLGIGKVFDGKKNMSVTHFFRHSFNRLLKESGVDQDTRSLHLGHKSKKSIKYYE